MIQMACADLIKILELTKINAGCNRVKVKSLIPTPSGKVPATPNPDLVILFEKAESAFEKGKSTLSSAPQGS